MTSDQALPRRLAQHGWLRAAAVDRFRAARMKRTSRRRIRRTRRLAAQRRIGTRTFGGRIGNGYGGEKRAGIRVLGTRVKLLRRRELDHLAEIHDGHAIGDLPHHAEIMRDEEVGEREALLEILEEIDDLTLQ